MQPSEKFARLEINSSSSSNSEVQVKPKKPLPFWIDAVISGLFSYLSAQEAMRFNQVNQMLYNDFRSQRAFLENQEGLKKRAYILHVMVHGEDPKVSFQGQSPAILATRVFLATNTLLELLGRQPEGHPNLLQILDSGAAIYRNLEILPIFPRQPLTLDELLKQERKRGEAILNIPIPCSIQTVWEASQQILSFFKEMHGQVKFHTFKAAVREGGRNLTLLFFHFAKLPGKERITLEEAALYNGRPITSFEIGISLRTIALMEASAGNREDDEIAKLILSGPISEEMFFTGHYWSSARAESIRSATQRGYANLLEIILNNRPIYTCSHGLNLALFHAIAAKKVRIVELLLRNITYPSIVIEYAEEMALGDATLLNLIYLFRHGF